MQSDKISAHKRPDKPTYVAGVKLTRDDQHHLAAEKVDASLTAELRAFKGTIKEFVDGLIPKNEQYVKDAAFDSVILKNNIRSRSIDGYIREFEKNESLRIHSRSNNVLAYHHVISFHKSDSPNITEKMLKDIGREYMSIRGLNNLYLGAVHQDKDHLHIHLIQSGVRYCTGLGNRVSRKEFQSQKEALQAYQLKKYPELVNSLPQHGKSKSTPNEKTPEKNIKTPERSADRVSLLGLLETIHSKANSTEQFLDMITQAGHQVYYRNGRLQGIKYEGERKFRFSTLGYKEKLQELAERKLHQEKSLKELRGIRENAIREPHARRMVTTTTMPEKGNEVEQLNELKELRQDTMLDRSDGPQQSDADATSSFDSLEENSPDDASSDTEFGPEINNETTADYQDYG